MESIAYHDFRGFVEAAKEVSEWRVVEGADWDGEIGALIEATAELDSRPLLLFDKIKGYPAGFRLPLRTTSARLSHSVSPRKKASSRSCVCSRAR
jgi:3-polyprenyl-4-hydroxybenzoate decarboxylase